MKKNKTELLILLSIVGVLAVFVARFTTPVVSDKTETERQRPGWSSEVQSKREKLDLPSVEAEVSRLEQQRRIVRDRRDRNLLPGNKFLELGMRGLVVPLKAELDLSARQVDQLVDLYTEVQEIRARYEQSLVTRHASKPNQLVFRIPAYVETGMHLRRLWADELAATFGQEKANSIESRIGAEIEQRFLGFGVCEQTFTVSEINDGPDILLKVFRSALVVPEAIPYMSPSIISFGGSGATAMFTLETLKTGEYSVVAPAIEQYLDRGGRIPPPTG